MAPRHQYELLSLVLISLPKAMLEHLAYGLGPEAEFWLYILETSQSAEINLKVAIEIDILTNAFNGEQEEASNASS